MWSFVVALPAVQADFGIARGEASLPYTLLMIGFALGSIATGRLADRFGIRATALVRAPSQSASVIVAAGAVLAAVAAHGGLCAARARHVGRLRSADRRHIALVRTLARHCGRHLLGRQLPRRRAVAAGDQLFHRRARAGARPISASAFSASSPCCRSRCCCGERCQFAHAAGGALQHAGSARPVADRAAGAAVDRRRRLLRRHVDAAGPYRGLLRRPRLRRGARRRDALADDGIRHRQPRRLGLHRRPGRRTAHAAARLGRCRASRWFSTRCSTGSPRST